MPHDAPPPGRVFAVSYSADGSRIAAAASFNGRDEVRVYREADGKLPATR